MANCIREICKKMNIDICDYYGVRSPLNTVK